MKFIVPDHTGDSQRVFGQDETAAAKAEFEKHVANKRTPIITKADGTREASRAFDPTAKEVLFIQPMVGG